MELEPERDKESGTWSILGEILYQNDETMAHYYDRIVIVIVMMIIASRRGHHYCQLACLLDNNRTHNLIRWKRTRERRNWIEGLSECRCVTTQRQLLLSLARIELRNKSDMNVAWAMGTKVANLEQSDDFQSRNISLAPTLTRVAIVFVERVSIFLRLD